MTDVQKTVKLELSEADVRSLLFLIRQRQDDCQKITEEYPTYQLYCNVEINLESLKQKIAKQVP